MTLNKLTDRIQSPNIVSTVNEIIDELNNGTVITVDTELNESSTNPVENRVVTLALSEKQDVLTAGDNITIENGVISGVGATYTAGTGISISEENVISATGGTAEWGNIQGTISEQSDLMTVLDEKQDISNLVTSVNLSSTNDTYPSAKAVYDAIADAECQLDILSDTNEHLILLGGTITPSSNFIPRGTVIHVELDGSGDFTDLMDAFNYLTDKYSNGSVTVEIGTGTFTLPDGVRLSGGYFNIPLLIIKGQGIDETIIQCAGNTQYTYGIFVNFANVCIESLTYQKTQGTKSTQYRGFGVRMGTLGINNVKTIGCGEAFISENGGTITIEYGVQVYDACTAFCATLGRLFILNGANLVLNNIGYAAGVWQGGYLQIASDCPKQLTNVDAKYTQTVDQITHNGYISAAL